MDFVLWTTRSVHLFCAVVWLGGLFYQAVVTLPVTRSENIEHGALTRHLLRRFVPFVWMCVWTIVVTGLALMLFNPRFVFLEYHDRWSIILGLKQLTFLLMVFFAFGYARMFSRLDALSSDGTTRPLDEVRPYYQRMLQFGRINVALGILVLLLSAGLT
jgi:putative copper export protein